MTSIQKTELTVVHSLKVIDQRQDVLVAHRYSLQHSNLIPHHMLPPRHEPLINDLRRIVPSGVDMDAFFHNTVRASAQCLSRLVATWLNLRLWLRRGHTGLPRLAVYKVSAVEYL